MTSSKKPIADYVKKRIAIDDLTSSMRLLQLIFERETITQGEGVDALGISVGTCCLHFKKLEHIGLIHRTKRIQKEKGRSIITWELDKKHNFYLILIFELPFLKISIVNFDNEVILKKEENISACSNHRTIEKKIHQFIEDAPKDVHLLEGNIRQAVVSIPGLIDPKEGIVIHTANCPALNGINFKKIITNKYNIPCHCGSIGATLHYSETQHLSSDTNILLLHWNYGIGGVVGEKNHVISYKDNDSMFTEMGHIQLFPNGKICHCGKRGCLEAYVGGYAMIEQLNDPKIQRLEELKDAIKDKKENPLLVANEAAYILGKSLIWPIQLMQVDRIIITGYLSTIFPEIKSSFNRGLEEFFSKEKIRSLNPISSKNPSLALEQGAVLSAQHRFFYPD